MVPACHQRRQLHYKKSLAKSRLKAESEDFNEMTSVKLIGQEIRDQTSTSNQTSWSISVAFFSALENEMWNKYPISFLPSGTGACREEPGTGTCVQNAPCRSCPSWNSLWVQGHTFGEPPWINTGDLFRNRQVTSEPPHMSSRGLSGIGDTWKVPVNRFSKQQVCHLLGGFCLVFLKIRKAQ